MSEIIKENELFEVNAGSYIGPCIRYTIKPGDCLSVLAQKFGTTVAILAEINNLKNPNFIRAYDTLLIPYTGKY